MQASYRGVIAHGEWLRNASEPAVVLLYCYLEDRPLEGWGRGRSTLVYTYAFAKTGKISRGEQAVERKVSRPLPSVCTKPIYSRRARTNRSS